LPCFLQPAGRSRRNAATATPQASPTATPRNLTTKDLADEILKAYYFGETTELTAQQAKELYGLEDGTYASLTVFVSKTSRTRGAGGYQNRGLDNKVPIFSKTLERKEAKLAEGGRVGR
jgi:hypothetical protein